MSCLLITKRKQCPCCRLNLVFGRIICRILCNSKNKQKYNFTKCQKGLLAWHKGMAAAAAKNQLWAQNKKHKLIINEFRLKTLYANNHLIFHIAHNHVTVCVYGVSLCANVLFILEFAWVQECVRHIAGLRSSLLAVIFIVFNRWCPFEIIFWEKTQKIIKNIHTHTHTQSHARLHERNTFETLSNAICATRPLSPPLPCHSICWCCFFG